MKKYIKLDSTSHNADKDTTHVYRYMLDDKAYFIELTDKERYAFEDKYDIRLQYWRD